jgi:hypothetical protein
LSLRAFVHASTSSRPAATAILQAVDTAPAGHLRHFCASSAQGPVCAGAGLGGAGLGACAACTAATVLAALGGLSAGGAALVAEAALARGVAESDCVQGLERPAASNVETTSAPFMDHPIGTQHLTMRGHEAIADRP